MSQEVTVYSEEPTIIASQVYDHPIQPEPPQKKKSVAASLKKIAVCESGDRQFDEGGNIIRGKVNPQDIGRYQINLKYHEKEARSMGLDLFVEEDNEKYAEHLYETQGAQPWKASNPCHHLLDK